MTFYLVPFEGYKISAKTIELWNLDHWAKAHYNIEWGFLPHVHEQSFESMSLATTPT
jgi:hypothetical protein